MYMKYVYIIVYHHCKHKHIIYINMVTNDMMCFLNKDGYLMEL